MVSTPTENIAIIGYFGKRRDLIGFLTLQFSGLPMPPFLSGGCSTVKTIGGPLLTFRIRGRGIVPGRNGDNAKDTNNSLITSGYRLVRKVG
jgi:hypothetical protein